MRLAIFADAQCDEFFGVGAALGECGEDELKGSGSEYFSPTPSPPTLLTIYRAED
jgi:hypothetical protein